MSRWEQIRKAVDLLLRVCGCACLAALTLALLAITREIPSTAAGIRAATTDVGAAARDAADAAENAQRDVSSIADALISDSDKITTESYRVLAIAGATESELHKAAVQQRQLWDEQAPLLATKLNDSFDKFNGVLDGAGDVMNAADKTLRKSWPLLNDAEKLIGDVDGRLADPRLDTMLTNGAAATASGAQILADGAKEVHRLVNPAKRAWWQSDLALGGTAMKWFFELLYYAHGAF